jgi:hypothetical protein
LDQAGNKLSETGEKIGDAVEGAKAKIGDAARTSRARHPTLRTRSRIKPVMRPRR